jgi:hypothetical protein
MAKGSQHGDHTGKRQTRSQDAQAHPRPRSSPSQDSECHLSLVDATTQERVLYDRDGYEDGSEFLADASAPESTHPSKSAGDDLPNSKNPPPGAAMKSSKPPHLPPSKRFVEEATRKLRHFLHGSVRRVVQLDATTEVVIPAFYLS